MKKSVGVLAAMVLGWTVNSALAQVDFVPRAKPKAPAKVGMTDKEFNAFTAALEKNAESWLSGEIADHAVLYQITQLNLQRAFSVGQITYDKSTIPLVKAYIDSSTKLKDPQRLYVLVKLLGAFVTAKPEVILEALPMVRDLEKKYHNAYKVYPSYGPAALKQFEIPEMTRGMDTAARLHNIEAIDKRRRERALKERPITVQDELIGELETIYVSMLAFAGDPKEDQNLLAWTQDNEQKGNYIWTEGAQALCCEAAAGMNPDRANKLYPLLLNWGTPLKYEARDYTAGFMPQPSIEANSALLKMKKMPMGYLVLTTAKLVGIAGKQAPITVPNPAKADRAKYGNDPEFWNPPPPPPRKPITK